jgi:hypothetical protein
MRRVLQVEHIKMETTKKFVDVEGALEQNVPQLDPALRTALANGDEQRRRSWNGVYRFSYF